ncbi:MAG TPA: response regulator [Gammaproteobacteria bacterium]|nr:response regulator [Gammaproteobacteria bacterium]
MKLNSIKAYILGGLGFVGFLFVCSILYAIFEIRSITKLSDKLNEETTPAVTNGLKLLANVNDSIAQIRGWMMSPNEVFKIKRQDTWSEINANITRLETLSNKWTDSQLALLKGIKTKLFQLKLYQEDIEQLSHTPDNNPSLNFYANTMVPLIDSLTQEAKSIQISEVEIKNFDPAPFNRILNEYQQTFEFLSLNLQAYLSGKSDSSRLKVVNLWAKQKDLLNQLKNYERYLTPVAKVSINKLELGMQRLESLQNEYVLKEEKIVTNKAEQLFLTQGTKLAHEISTDINSMISLQNKVRSNERINIHQRAADGRVHHIILLVLAFSIVVATCVVLLRKIIVPVKRTIDIAKNVSQGSFDVDINLQGTSEINQLGFALSQMVDYLKRATRVTSEVAKGNFEEKMIVVSEKDQLGPSVNEMIDSLKRFTERTNNENWVKTGQAKMAELLRSEEDLTQLGSNVIKFLSEYVKAAVGTFYLITENNKLKLHASYAYHYRKGSKTEFSIGESLVGQAALEKSTIVVNEIPKNYIKIQSGIGESEPKSLIISPLIINKRLKGVIELGTFEPLNELQRTFIESTSEAIAISIASLQDREHLRNLVDQTKAQAEELQQQSEELKASNEELEEQAEALKASEEQLREQSEQLRVTNEELEEKTESLEKQQKEIEKKNMELQRKQQEVTQKAQELENSSRYKSEFLANMSHELRTPLNSLLILSEVLMENNEKNLNEEQLESIKVIYNGGKDLLNLINDILDISKVEAGKLKVQYDVVEIKQIIEDIKKQFDPISMQTDIPFKIVLSKKLPETMVTDPLRLEQILKNLLANAFKFTHKGQVELKICHANENVQYKTESLKNTDTMAFSVKDTGVGIAKENLQRIFEAFQQVDGTTSRKYGGTGLGLTISNKIADILGGEIQVKSKEGKGSEFTLYVPIKATQNLQTQEEIRITEEVESATQFFQETTAQQTFRSVAQPLIDGNAKGDTHRTVLIIEDDQDFAQLLSKVAKEKGYIPIHATNGTSGMQMAQEKIPSAIILDLGLPDKDGLEILESLKNHNGTKNIPIHICSCKDAQTSALKMGALGSLLKPARLNELYGMFNKIELALQDKLKEILIVEDNPSSQHAITALFKNQNINIVTAECGMDALRLLSNRNFDCMILDYRLPDMTGLELLKQFSQSEKYHTQPTIIYTGKDLTQDEYMELNKYTNNIILKVSNSRQRLYEEASLFLHSLPGKGEDKTKKTKLAHIGEKLKNKRVLLVDDDMRNVFALSTALKKFNLDLTIAGNGKMALDKLATNDPFDLIIMDIMMPEMDGYEAMKHIRADARFNHIPIICLTAKAMAGDEKKCMDAGANDYLTKPVDLNLLTSMIKLWLEQSHENQYGSRSA